MNLVSGNRYYRAGEEVPDSEVPDLSSKTRTGLLLLIEVNGLATALKARR